MKDALEETEKQDTPVTIVTDGAYCGQENEQIAESKNVTLVTTNLTGRETEDILGDFEFSEDGKTVVKCPCGHAPKSCSYNAKTGQCVVSFHKDCCMNCPMKKQCHPKECSRVCRKSVSVRSRNRALSQSARKTEEFRRHTCFRNGVETIPSILRRKYGIDKIPVRGFIPSKFFFGCKIGALNIKKFCKYMQGREKCALIAANA